MKKFIVRGFALYELMLSAVILAFTLSALLALYMRCLFMDESNRNLTTAISHSQYVMEEFKSKSFASINSEVWDSAAISAKGMSPMNNETINITVNKPAIGSEPLTIIVMVNWRDRGALNRNIALESLISEQ